MAAGPACKSLLPIAEWEPEMSIVFLCNCLIFGAIAWLRAAKLNFFFLTNRAAGPWTEVPISASPLACSRERGIIALQQGLFPQGAAVKSRV